MIPLNEEEDADATSAVASMDRALAWGAIIRLRPRSDHLRPEVPHRRREKVGGWGVRGGGGRGAKSFAA